MKVQNITGKKWPVAPIMVFDLDGVITREKGYFEKAWALLWRQIIKNEKAEIKDLTAEDLQEGSNFRKSTKGGLLFDRISKLIEQSEHFHAEEDIHKFLNLFVDSVRGQQLVDFMEDNFEEYLEEDVRDFLLFLDNLEIPCYIITANIQEQLEWIADKLDIKEFFSGLYGYPKDDSQITKKDFLEMIIDANSALPRSVVFVGDGTSDMFFGKQAGVLTVGVADDDEKSQQLIAAGADITVGGVKDIYAYLVDQLWE
jgi:phosphoglycolate phosphatase-like HAD superfamily hydrolase